MGGSVPDALQQPAVLTLAYGTVKTKGREIPLPGPDWDLEQDPSSQAWHAGHAGRGSITCEQMAVMAAGAAFLKARHEPVDKVRYNEVKEWTASVASWPDTLEGEAPMVKRSEFVSLDDLMASVIESKFAKTGMSLPLVPASQRVLERAAEAALGQWVAEKGLRTKDQQFLLALHDDEGLPVMDILVSEWRVVMDPVDSAWTKIVWGRS